MWCGVVRLLSIVRVLLGVVRTLFRVVRMLSRSCEDVVRMEL
jgi:hypothetical protein